MNPRVPIFVSITAAIFFSLILGFRNFWTILSLALSAGILFYLHSQIRELKDFFLSEISLLKKNISDLRQQLRDELEKVKQILPEVPGEPEPDISQQNEIQAQDTPREYERILESQSLEPTVIDPQTRSEPASEGFQLELFDLILKYFSKGNTIAKVGIVLLFFGVAFLLKYASDQGFFPIELRLLSAAGGAIVLLLLGWRFRFRTDPAPFGLILQGGGIGIFYLTIFASFRVYEFIPADLAFSLLFSTVVISGALALLQDSKPLAAIGITGGFLAPVLTSTGHGSHVALFSFYAVLNLGILGIAWFKSWRELNLLGFLFTFIIGSAWGYRFYKPGYFYTTEPFLIFFFLLYLGVTILFSIHSKNRTNAAGDSVNPAPNVIANPIDGSLVFGVPVAAFALQRGLVHEFEYGLAITAAIMGALYVVVAKILYKQRANESRLLVEAFLSIGVCFLTLAVPFTFNEKWTSAVWALEGAGIYWTGLRQSRFLPRLAGITLQFLSSFVFIFSEFRSVASFPVFNSFFLGIILLTLSQLFISFQISKASEKDPEKRGETHSPGTKEKIFKHIFLWSGMAFWFLGGFRELKSDYVLAFRTLHRLFFSDLPIDSPHPEAFLALFVGASCTLFWKLSFKINWVEIRNSRFVLLPAMILFSLSYVGFIPHPFSQGGWLAWPVCFAFFYSLLKSSEGLVQKFEPFQHFGAFWLVTFLVTREVFYQLEHWVRESSLWARVSLAFVPSAIACFTIQSVGRFTVAPESTGGDLSTMSSRFAWPFVKWRVPYLRVGIFPLIVGSGLWLFILNLSDSGQAGPLSYIPLANPLELSIFFFFTVLFYWMHRAHSCFVEIDKLRPLLWRGFGVYCFFVVTCGLIRVLHHWGGVLFGIDLPWAFSEILSSHLVQTSLSIFWSLLSLALMNLATRNAFRGLWITGAGLLGIVVIKLFLVDLSGRGTFFRIISFIGTGLLLLLIGYVAPIPPPEKKANDIENYE